MKKKLTTLLVIGALVISSLTACSLDKTCKYDGCDETEIYKDGYCKYHYAITFGDNALKEFVNNH